MIHTIQIKKGLLQELLGARNITFSPTITMIWGGNGIGKSSLLHALAHYSCIGAGGFVSGFSKDIHMCFDLFNTESRSIEEMLDIKAPTGTCKVDWDGTPSVYLSMEHTAGKRNIAHQIRVDEFNKENAPYYNDQSLVEGLFSSRELFALLRSELSSGEIILALLEKIEQISLPDLTIQPFNSIANYTHQKSGQDFVEFIATKPRDGKPTLLLDEPDRNLDYENQYNLFVNLLPQLAQQYQIIVASHSPFVFMEEFDLVDLDNSAQKAKYVYENIGSIWDRSLLKKKINY